MKLFNFTKRNSYKNNEVSNPSKQQKSMLNSKKRIRVSKLNEEGEAPNNSNFSFGENEYKNPSLAAGLNDVIPKEKTKVKFQECEEDSKSNFYNNSNSKLQNNNVIQVIPENKNLNKIRKKIRNVFEITKCGFQGAKIEKTNQDNFVVTKNILANEQDTYFFAVL